MVAVQVVELAQRKRVIQPHKAVQRVHGISAGVRAGLVVRLVATPLEAMVAAQVVRLLVVLAASQMAVPRVAPEGPHPSGVLVGLAEMHPIPVATHRQGTTEQVVVAPGVLPMPEAATGTTGMSCCNGLRDVP